MMDRPVRAAKTKASEAIRAISSKSKRSMKKTQANAKPKKIIKKLSATESELKAGKVNSKSVVKKVLKDISNNTNDVSKEKGKSKLQMLQVHSLKSATIQKTIKTLKVEPKAVEAKPKTTPLPPIALESFKESFMTSSMTSLNSTPFVPADISTPMLKHSNATVISQPSEFFVTTTETSSCIKIESLDSPMENEPVQRSRYTFGMLDADDSTDDEDDVHNKPNKRPPPPEWSLPANRVETILRQTNISTVMVDHLFGGAPDVNLQEIFPEIAQKLLTRRDSSFVWRTPPRYSVLPKY